MKREAGPEDGEDQAERAASSSLEYGTKLVGRREARWSFALYPEAAEGGGSFRSVAWESSGGKSSAGDSEANAADAARRARGQVRRYCAENRLNRLGTLTYAGAGNHLPKALRVDLADFFRRLRGIVGEPFPYLWAPEWHPGGHGLHAHFAVGRWIAQGDIKAAWGRGHVHIKLLGDLPVGSGTLGEARLAARYLAKYVGKELAAGGQPSGLHRYEVAQGFQPRKVTIYGDSADEVIGWAATFMGSEAERVWRSRDEEGWDRPPAIWASWA
jgi:hypothetical protein